jgi:hypothetical protein
MMHRGLRDTRFFRPYGAVWSSSRFPTAHAVANVYRPFGAISCDSLLTFGVPMTLEGPSAGMIAGAAGEIARATVSAETP